MEKLRVSLRTRFIIYVTFLIIFLVSLVLFFIEKREVKTIFEESKNKGLLIAQNIANLNLGPLLFWDLEAIKLNIENEINDKLIYIVFYDRENKPLVANEFIRNYKEIYFQSSLKGDITPEDYYFKSITLKPGKSNKVLRILEVEIPVFAKNSPRKWGTVKIGLSLEDMYKEIRKTRLILIFLGVGGIILGIIGAVFLARRITNPLKKLVEGTIRISQGDYTYKIDISPGDEISDLAHNFNKMSSQLLQSREKIEETNKKLIQAEKLASIGRISTGIAHEIRNPLTSVKLNIQKIADSPLLEEIEKEHLEIAQEGINQIDKIVKDILDFARVSQLNLDRFSIEQIMEESLKIVSNAINEKKIIIEKESHPNLPHVLVDGDKLRQVFLNILLNSIDAVSEGGKIIIGLSLLSDKNSKKIRVIINDNGCGIPEKDLENIFEPFFTTKSSGTGLGLANARKIIDQHNSSIKAFSQTGKGTTFEIIIPCEE
ncbi:MAG: PAS domain-containing sensor histidine kinase [Candidatus Aminicenantia bacterium]